MTSRYVVEAPQLERYANFVRLNNLAHIGIILTMLANILMAFEVH